MFVTPRPTYDILSAAGARNKTGGSKTATIKVEGIRQGAEDWGLGEKCRDLGDQQRGGDCRGAELLWKRPQQLRRRRVQDHGGPATPARSRHGSSANSGATSTNGCIDGVWGPEDWTAWADLQRRTHSSFKGDRLQDSAGATKGDDNQTTDNVKEKQRSGLSRPSQSRHRRHSSVVPVSLPVWYYGGRHGDIMEEKFFYHLLANSWYNFNLIWFLGFWVG